jgi:isocitrate dehydrogenase kinase/phosphatase
VHARYSALLRGLIDAELYKTFYNTLSRRLFSTRGVDPALEFIAFDVEPSDAITHPVARHTYAVSPTRPVEALRVLADYRFDIPCAPAAARRPSPCACRMIWPTGVTPVRSIELLDTVFYRERRAYLVGRVFGEHRFSPCVIALVNDGRACVPMRC